MELIKEIENRFSGKQYSSKTVEDEKIKSVIEAASTAPSCFNEQPWKFFVAKRGTEEFNIVLNSLAEGNQIWAKNAPVLIVGITSNKFSRNGKENRWAGYDLGQSMAYLSIQATHLGLNLHQMGGFDEADLKKSLNLGKDHDIYFVSTLGYLDNEKQGSRSRKSLDENIYKL